jgi:hypothetical protein
METRSRKRKYIDIITKNSNIDIIINELHKNHDKLYYSQTADELIHSQYKFMKTQNIIIEKLTDEIMFTTNIMNSAIDNMKKNLIYYNWHKYFHPVEKNIIIFSIETNVQPNIPI